MIEKITKRLQQAWLYFWLQILIKAGYTKIKLRRISFPVFFRKNTSDVRAFHQIFTFKEYDMNLSISPRFIVDAGANIGLAAVYFSNRFKDATILSIEPELSNFEMLQKNTLSYKNIIPVKKALSNVIGTNLNVLDRGFGNWGFSTDNENSSPNCKIVDTVQTLTIDEIFSEYNLEYLDLLKIDIEGGEKQLFESNYEKWLPRTKCIIIELHDGMTKGSSTSFFKAISKYDFSYFNRGENLFFINNTIK